MLLALLVGTFGLIVDNLLNIDDDRNFVVGFTVIVVVGISVLVDVLDGAVVVVIVDWIIVGNSVTVLLTDFDTIDIGKIPFDVTFSL